MVSLDKCSWSCNFSSPKICVPSKTKDINAKAFNMITNENEAKAMTKDISCNFKFKLILQPVIQIKSGIIKHVNVNVKIIESAKKAIGGILAHDLWEQKVFKNYCWYFND